MKLDSFTIQALAKIIAGDSEKLVYRSGSKLVDLFNEYGARDTYGQGFPTRWKYAEEKIHTINNTKDLERLILHLIDGRNFLYTDFDNSTTIESINKFIKFDKYKIIEIEDSYAIEGSLIEEDKPSVEVEFKEVQDKLVSELQKAKYIILAAVAWITDETVYNVLKMKKESGVTVKLIISDDDTNKNSGLNYNIFETYKMPKFGKFRYNIMHNKFCIIDLKTVLEGSYNWTKSADYHKEHFVVINSYENAEIFANRFIELREQIINQTYEIDF
ncbi:hypothetical protein JW813_05280 [Clostridium botulinum]|uniref:phospholipase D-like domain-containing protein n=1 Tax=Clostridium botulinum TaxID=1491 RepID=UPI0022456753|nr:phospholipase D-like domain-containing protein [Clostridium botulinum]UZP04421.1 hypothetical protein JW813_05280 [Clostridium botulinum]UZP07833.1 hypothetical protein JYA71_05555 [Clostridium botulinum]UZP11160.1 hypothetical protein JYA74_05275 [Clostridium botulinum]